MVDYNDCINSQLKELYKVKHQYKDKLLIIANKIDLNHKIKNKIKEKIIPISAKTIKELTN